MVAKSDLTYRVYEDRTSRQWHWEFKSAEGKVMGRGSARSAMEARAEAVRRALAETRGSGNGSKHTSEGDFRGYFIRLNSAPPFKIISKRLFEPLEMGGENKPIFGSTGKTPAVPFVAGGFRQLLFGATLADATSVASTSPRISPLLRSRTTREIWAAQKGPFPRRLLRVPDCAPIHRRGPFLSAWSREPPNAQSEPCRLVDQRCRDGDDQ